MDSAKKVYNKLVKTEEYKWSDDATMCLALKGRGFDNVYLERGRIKFGKQTKTGGA